MSKALIVIDMQNDFITGSLANKDAEKLVRPIAEYVKNFDGDVYATRDTHFKSNYLKSQEGKKLPIEHCIETTWGWNIAKEIGDAIMKKEYFRIVNKPRFGSLALGDLFATYKYDEVEICGVCTDICVISNAMILKASAIEDTEITVLKNLCAGTTPENHENAIKAMELCQINIKEV